MDYQKHYEQLIAKHGSQDKPEGYSERHHIVPKSMGGSNDDDNLVYLSAKAHFVAHHLLWRWHRNRSMAFAFWAMCSMDRDGVKHKATPVQYAVARSAATKATIGRRHSDASKRKMSEALKGKVRTKEMRAAATGARRSDEAKANMSKSSAWAKSVNFYLNSDDSFLATSNSVNSYAAKNGLQVAALCRTATADRTKPSSRSNPHHHKGLYARYV